MYCWSTRNLSGNGNYDFRFAELEEIVKTRKQNKDRMQQQKKANKPNKKQNPHQLGKGDGLWSRQCGVKH